MSSPTIAKPSSRPVINFRMAIFLLVLLSLPGMVLFVMIHERLTGGIVDRGEYFDVNLRSMSDFEMDQRYGTIEDVPPLYRQLDGKRVMLVGEMWQPRVASGQVSSFDLVYSISKCCLSGPAKVQHFVRARVQEGGQVRYHPGSPVVRVLGTLRVDVETEGGQVISVYHLDVESVEPV